MRSRGGSQRHRALRHEKELCLVTAVWGRAGAREWLDGHVVSSLREWSGSGHSLRKSGVLAGGHGGEGMGEKWKGQVLSAWF